jgi:EEF1A lysine methyltransferase 4
MAREDEPRNEEFQTREYWDKRYASEPAEEDFDWFKTYAELKNIFDEIIQPQGKNSKILMLGCGNSTLTSEMVADGYKNITNLDYSDVLIQKMKARFPDQDWRTMDVRELKENANQLGGKESWDIILDKGTMDALMAERGSVWDPSEIVRTNVKREIDGVLQ